MHRNIKTPAGLAHDSGRLRAALLVVSLLAMLLDGCSVRQYAFNRVGDAIANSGTTFSADEDPDLIRDASPFSLKLMESLLSENPQHRGLLLAAAKGFTQYAFAFLQQEADELETRDIEAANRLRDRAKRLYLRARDYGLRGLETSHSGFAKNLRENPKITINDTNINDVPLLYWTAASWAAAISLSKDKPELIADLPLVELLMDQALKLNESFDSGSIHTFLISYEPARQGIKGDASQRSHEHFERAIELSGGLQAAPYVSLAETISIKKQDLAGFQSLLAKALSVDIDARTEWRLVNLVMQRRARWLLAHTDQFFLE